MANARKIKSGYWVVGYRDEVGKCRSRSFGKGRAAKKSAEQFATEVDFKKAHGEPLPQSRAEGIYLDTLSQAWIDEKRAQGRKARWLAEWSVVFNKHFLDPLCKHPAHTIVQADIIAIIGAHYADAAQATRNRYVGYLKSIFEYGVEQGHLKANPLAKWKKGKEPRHKSPLTMEGMKAIAAVAPPHLAWALEVAWNIPARPGPADLFALRFDKHVKWKKGGIDVHHSKVGKDTFIRLTKDFLDDLAAREKVHKSGHLIEFKGKPVMRLDTAIETAARNAGLAYPVRFYDVRHLWITTALDRGHEMSVIADMAGTSVEMIQKHYYEPHAAQKAQVAADMPRISEQVTARANVVKLVVKK